MQLTFAAPVCRFPALLQDLEDSKAEIGVDSYGLEVTTLEEVFLAVSAAASADAKATRQRSSQPALSAPASADEKAEVAVDVDALHQAPGHGGSNGAKSGEQHVPLLRVSPSYYHSTVAAFLIRSPDPELHGQQSLKQTRQTP